MSFVGMPALNEMMNMPRFLACHRREKNIEDTEIRRRIEAGETKAAVARDLDISRMTVYRAVQSQNTKKPS